MHICLGHFGIKMLLFIDSYHFFYCQYCHCSIVHVSSLFWWRLICCSLSAPQKGKMKLWIPLLNWKDDCVSPLEKLISPNFLIQHIHMHWCTLTLKALWIERFVWSRVIWTESWFFVFHLWVVDDGVKSKIFSHNCTLWCRYWDNILCTNRMNASL